MRQFLAIICLAVLTACTSIQADTPAKRLALVDAAFTEVVKQAANAREEGRLSSDTIAELDLYITLADSALDEAWIALGSGATDVEIDAQVSAISQLVRKIRLQLAAQEASNVWNRSFDFVRYRDSNFATG